MTEPIARIEAALARLGAEHEPPPGWEARVLAATAARKRRAWWWVPVPVFALAAAGLLVVVILRNPAFDVGLSFDSGSKDTHRSKATGDIPQQMVGDTVHASAQHGAPLRAVWIYHGSQLVAACPRDPQCRVTGDATGVDYVLSVVGRYTIVAMHSSAPIPPPSGAYDDDVARAERAGAVIRTRDFDVR